jgi:hypothetical protein
MRTQTAGQRIGRLTFLLQPFAKALSTVVTAQTRCLPGEAVLLAGSPRYLSADADCAGLPKTLRHPSLKFARCRRMQAVIRSTSGISEEQSRRTSGVQSRRASSCVNARLAEGHNAPDAAIPATSNNPRTQTA